MPHKDDMKMLRSLTVVIAVLCSGCASLGRPRDALCSEMLRFADSLTEKETRRVALCVSWGPGCTEATEVLMSKSCEHGGNEAGRRFCSYLINHTSAEFPNVNFSSALACLGHKVYRPERYYDIQWGNAEVTTEAMPGLAEGVSITIEKVRATAKEPAKLHFIAHRN
jgi:hypothetical protein